MFLGEAGFPDEYFIVTGMITGLALVPLQPIYSLLFRMVETPSAAKRRVKRELKAIKDEIERQEKLARKEEIKQQPTRSTVSRFRQQQAFRAIDYPLL